MANAADVHGSVFESSSAVLLARVEQIDGQPIQQADLSSIVYTVSELDRCSGQRQSVVGHDAASLSISEVVFDTLQTGPPWDSDATGYNFRHEIDVTTYEAFPSPHTTYQVRYELMPTSGQKIVFRFQLQAM